MAIISPRGTPEATSPGHIRELPSGSFQSCTRVLTAVEEAAGTERHAAFAASGDRDHVLAELFG